MSKSTDQKEIAMNTIASVAVGSRVRLTEGTTAFVATGNTHTDGPLAGFAEFEKIAVDEFTSESLELTVTMVGTSHATMNGGGRDYVLRDENDVKVQVRTSFQRPESATFIVL